MKQKLKYLLSKDFITKWLKWQAASVLGFVLSTTSFHVLFLGLGLSGSFDWFFSNMVGGTTLYIISHKYIFVSKKKATRIS